MTKFYKLLTLTFSVSFSVGVSNATDVTSCNPDEARAAATQSAIVEGIRLSKVTEETRAKLDEARVEAIQSAVAEAIRLSNYCGSADPRNCVHSK